MPKRKRQDEGQEEDIAIEDQALRIKVTRLKAKVHQGIKRLQSALKLARGFERQKLGRRQKTANDEPQTLLRLREEVVVLKQLQLDQTAQRYLLKHLVKAKRIREHPAFVHAYGQNPAVDPTKSTAEANVLGRLFKATPVKNVVPEIMKTIYDVLGIPQTGPSSETDGKSSVPKSIKQTIHSVEAEEEEFHGFSSDNAQPNGHEHLSQASGSDSEEDRLLSEYAAGRLASSSGGESENDGSADHKRLDSQYGNSRRDISVSPSPSDSLDRAEARTGDESSIQRLTKTAFLPSLSLGGYYSGSESEDEDTYKHRGPAEPKIRKNRRGQRARQQLAELKFGKNAKHLAKQKEQNPRDAGWDLKRGAVAPGDRPRERFRKSGDKTMSNGNTTGPARTTKSKSKTRDDGGALHPSWEAAKKRKMQDQVQATFAGKKITFD
ncbi:hypothetical protein A1O1_04397 [Capronia coronata CBS 617.96]|uniref:Bud22 domain-containing protein n=1 Tax=Capronia coronata CBS 617.96 TaxID=1182541 RepID=W9YEI5_9EURO|nr:uncharacterized protein A1O1_04397 [Capronia coronata CBS 617.96]EXJ91287.1 hypothetical protein A1O1_04397 [Capronia coronata CBS 617.96]